MDEITSAVLCCAMVFLETSAAMIVVFVLLMHQAIDWRVGVSCEVKHKCNFSLVRAGVNEN